MKMYKSLILILAIIMLLTPARSSWAQENYISWEHKKNVDMFKSWNIRFSDELMDSSINNENIYVLDEHGILQSTQVFIKGKTEVIVQAPTEGYAPNKTYTLNINSVKSISGDTLKQSIKMEFTIEEAEVEKLILGSWTTQYDGMNISVTFSEDGQCIVYVSGLSSKGNYTINENIMNMYIIDRNLIGKIEFQNANQFTVTSFSGKVANFSRLNNK